ncbi:glycine--tRNA ligase subunit beta [Pokkaliibacter sp. CJK22405]|uniref:glycine--tRNA ligase subunit beta n=1 Tax=Pokkaliibacter sp. CJK22405 TaxID=3384615 RepID=UPI00398496D6
MEHLDFLVELGTEELPPKALTTLRDAFAQTVIDGLAAAGIPHGAVKTYAAPRRLAFIIEQLSTSQPDREIKRSGPAISAPEKAVEGFARSCGVTIAELAQEETAKGTYYIFNQVEQGKATTSLLPGLIQQSIDKLPIPKRMRWGASRVEFVRPAHWLVALFGEQVVDCEVLGLKSGRETRGHRFHCNRTLDIPTPGSYLTVLKDEGYVLADHEARREKIRVAVEAEAAKVGGTAKIDPSLLDEVTALNEWPVALMGRFEEHFLEVPAQALISTMESNQKYFTVTDAQGNLLPCFITIANLESKDPAQVIAGNEKVVRPRLADAAFFFETDKKHRLDSYQDKLKNIVFQKDLGTLFEKSERVASIASLIASQLNHNADWAARAAMLSKCDLVTQMVLEFPELQGLMGFHYATKDGEAEEVARAQDEQYMPRFAGDQLPATLTGAAVSLGDRLDTLTGLFGINQPPTGSKDPFALRRSALGALRIMVEKELDLDLKALLEHAVNQHQGITVAKAEVVEKVLDFMLDRFKAWFEDEGMGAAIYQSVLVLKPTKPLDFARRARAVSAFQSLPEAESLAAANKRVSNLLSKNADAVVDGQQVSVDLFEGAAEKALFDALQAVEADVAPLFAAGNYAEALKRLTVLKAPVDTFFEDVMVMCDDEKVRANRLALLQQLRSLFLHVADISHLSS